tara:strand:- start:22 stop:786 length:765 start_codon:yes stop_codon:yes gene_type:complete
MYLAGNLKFLRKSKKLTQAQFAEKVGLTRSVIGAYEEGRAEPKLQSLLIMSQFFDLSLDDFLLTPIDSNIETSFQGSPLRVLPISVDKSTDKELVTLVPYKAAAGYLAGFEDVEYISSLPTFHLPLSELPQDQSYRAFQIEGDSMLPIASGAYVIGSFMENWAQVGGNKSYIVVMKDEGIVFKRLEKNKSSWTFHSNNADFESYRVEPAEVSEIWQARAHLSFSFPNQPSKSDAMQDIQNQLSQLRTSIQDLKS